MWIKLNYNFFLRETINCSFHSSCLVVHYIKYTRNFVLTVASSVVVTRVQRTHVYGILFVQVLLVFFLCVLLFHFYSVFIYYKSKIKMVRNLLFAQKYKHATKETCIIFFLCEFLKSTRIENGVLEIFIRCRGDTRSYCSSLVKNVAKC